MKLKIHVKFDRDVHVGYGEAVLLLISTAKRSWLLLGATILNDSVSKGALGKAITLVEGIGAAPALGEVKFTILEVRLSNLNI